MPFIGLELTLGILLLSGILFAKVRIVAIIAFAVFALAAISEALIGKKSCGCFGAVQIPPWYTAAFDICAVAGLLICKPPVISPQRPHSVRRIVFAGVIVLAGVATAAVWEAHRPVVVMTDLGAAEDVDQFGAAGSLVVLEPSGWIGKRFSLAGHIDVGSKLDSGRWIVMLVHHDCDECIAAVPRYEAMAARHAGVKLAIIEMPPYATAGEQLPITADVALSGRLDTTRDWFATTPVAVLLKDGVVREAVDGDKANSPDPSWWGK
jgi:hypothetical protein